MVQTATALIAHVFRCLRQRIELLQRHHFLSDWVEHPDAVLYAATWLRNPSLAARRSLAIGRRIAISGHAPLDPRRDDG